MLEIGIGICWSDILTCVYIYINVHSFLDDWNVYTIRIYWGKCWGFFGTKPQNMRNVYFKKAVSPKKHVRAVMKVIPSHPVSHTGWWKNTEFPSTGVFSIIPKQITGRRSYITWPKQTKGPGWPTPFGVEVSTLLHNSLVLGDVSAVTASHWGCATIKT